MAFDSPVGEQEVAVNNALGKIDEALHASSIAEAGMSESRDRRRAFTGRVKHSQKLTSCRSQLLKVKSKYEQGIQHVSTHK